MKTKITLVSLSLLALVLSACGAAMPLYSNAPAPKAPAVPVTGATSMPAGGGAEVDVAQSASLGSILVDSKGMTLYILTKDMANTSTCTGGCATIWPPLLTSGKPTAGNGVDASLLGTTKRPDGTTQVTYSSRPLYYFASDKAAGDTNGQGIQNVWFVIDPTGKPVTAAVSAPASSSSSSSTGSSSSSSNTGNGYTVPSTGNGYSPLSLSSGAMVNAFNSPTFGNILVDSKGMTLYIFTKDTPNTSNCYNTCATYWPPLLTTGAPVAGTGLTATMLGTTQRTNGTTQVTYNGWPLYYYIGDKSAGDTNGENVQGIWFVIDTQGMQK